MSRIELMGRDEDTGSAALLTFAFISALFLPSDCYAYIDPNAGGWLFQLLFPVLVAIGGVWGVFRQRIGALWNRIFRRGEMRK